MSITSITPRELEQRRQRGEKIDLVDVRTAGEYRAVHAEGARSVPLGTVSPQTIRADRPDSGDSPVYIICQSGGRSMTACQRLQEAGMTNVVNVEGGTSAWKRAGLPVVREAGATGGAFVWIRRVGLLVVLAGLVLGWVVNPWFSLVSIIVWLGLIVAGGGTCPLGTCAVPDRARHPGA